MRGIELSRKYYEEFGLPMLSESFPDLLPKIAVGFAGQGSEHFGYDDEISRDHDFEPGFTVFLPDETLVDRKEEFLLEKAYAKLPREYMGVRRQLVAPVGGSRNGVLRIADFFEKTVGFPDGNLSAEAWLRVPDYALAEAVNGEVFHDGLGILTKIRENLANMPRDVKLKRIAGNLLLMGQSGQYNFSRCIKHGESEAAQLALNEFVTSALKVAFLMNNRYMPFYKWSFRALSEIEGTEKLREFLSSLLFGDNRDEKRVKEKSGAVEEVASLISADLLNLGFSLEKSIELEVQAYAVNSQIEDAEIRNRHILYAI